MWCVEVEMCPCADMLMTVYSSDVLVSFFVPKYFSQKHSKVCSEEHSNTFVQNLNSLPTSLENHSEMLFQERFQRVLTLDETLSKFQMGFRIILLNLMC